jgi:SpoIID/LytB domain protein
VRKLALPSLVAAVVSVGALARADEMSGADKLRVVYSPQIAWTQSGLPLVPVRILEGRDEVRLSGGKVRVLPDGEGGAAIVGGHRYTVRVRNGRPAVVRWHVVVERHAPGGPELAEALERWRSRGLTPKTFEVGALVGIRGEVLDTRRVLVAVAPQTSEAAARAEAKRLAEAHHLSGAAEPSVHPELVERPRGTVVATDENGVSVENEGIVWFSPGPSGGALEVEDVDRESGGRETRRYAGLVYVTVDSTGRLAVVNAVAEDRLLAGLVPAEMPASSPPEALKAQAIAARNELFAKLGTRHLTDPYRLCAKQHCQVYAGIGSEDARATAAVEATRGELIVRDGAPIDTLYSSSCGGHGEDGHRAFGGTADPALRGRLDVDHPPANARFATVDESNVAAFLAEAQKAQPFCARGRGATTFRWSQPIDLAAVARRTGAGEVRDIVVNERGVSGRALSITIVGAQKRIDVRGELAIRRVLGPGERILKSSLFVLRPRRDAGGGLVELVAEGGGHGHGVGMCQQGAIGRAEAGQTYRQILEHYYPGAIVKRYY